MNIEKKWRLRWAFFWKDGQHKYGLWDNQSPHKHEQAQYLKRDLLDRVEIHGKEMKTGVTHTLMSVPFENFKQIKWVGQAVVPIFTHTGQKITCPPRVYGIQLHTIKDGAVQFLLNGKIRKEVGRANYHYDQI